MKISANLCRLFAAILPLAASGENEIGFVEKFALASDREQVLGQLIPASEEYYFYHALHFQSTRQAGKLKTTMEQWAKRFPKSSQRRVIENREALLSYDADPRATLAFLRNRLNLQFNHQQEARDRKPDLPTTLDQARITRGVFQSEALRDSDDLSRFDDAALEALVREKVALKPSQVRALLARIERPDVPGLVEVIDAELKMPESKGFGEFAIHRALLPEQLEDLAKRRPALADNQSFVFARLRKLFPSAEADAEFDPAEREAWLERAWANARNLGPAFNTLKAHILFRRLQHDRSRGIYDKARFLEYLKLPRRMSYVNPEFLKRAEPAGHFVDPNADLSEALRIAPPIGNDEALVREYLLHLLKDEPAWEPYAVWLRDTWLKPLFAEAKIVAGVGDPETWAALLSPAAFQALKDRVDVDFSPASPPFHAPGDDVNLDLVLKNVPKLIIKVYEINTLSFFLTRNRQLNTDVQLDGLVANRESTQDFTGEPAGRNPFRRVPRTFKFPELKGKRGAWMIEFIGGGRSSRALVRTGQWSLLQQTGPAGEMLTVVDEARQPVRDAVVWLDGRRFTPDEKSGRILVPFTQEPGNKPIILADPAGEFATLTNFEHHAEQYRLDAQFHIEREQLLARREAVLAIRSALLLGDAQVSLELLQERRLSITSTTLDGVSTTSEVKAPALDPGKVFVHTITVPERLAQLTVTLFGTVENLSAGREKKELSAARTWRLNGIDKTEATSDGHLSRFGNRYVFELLGKNGEPLPDQQVVFEFTHRDFRKVQTLALRTDDRGRADLGELKNISALNARFPNGRTDSWNLRETARSWPALIHAKAGGPVRVPWNSDLPLGDSEVSLLEMRGDTYFRNLRDAVSLADGFLEIQGLAPGDYSLALPTERLSTTIRVTDGSAVQSWLLSKNRHLEIRDPAPLTIQSITADASSVVVQIRNANRFTRVHVAASRFLPENGIFAGLGGFERFAPALGIPAKLPSLFAAGREIGDEYRYILERRYARIFPGNMLTRPGLLLNPWEVRSTDVVAVETKAGQAAGGTAGGRGRATIRSVEEKPRDGAERAATAEDSNLDFLATAAPALFNLTPDENGVVRIDRKALGDRQHLQVYAEDLTSAASRTIALTEVPTKFQDLRLTRNLDPQKHFTEKKQVTALTAGQALTLPDILTSELETFDSLASVHALFTTLSANGNLAKFSFVLQWAQLKEEEKRARYSEFACHELSFFLSRKDPAFFETVIQPYLRNKKDKTFLDEYLLGADLRRYLEPWAYARLNVAERALLGRRIPAEAAAAARHLRELSELLPPDPARLDLLFETALRGRALQETDEAGAFASVKANQVMLEDSEVALGKKASPLAASAPALPAPAAPGKPADVRLGKARSKLGVDELEFKKSVADLEGRTRGGADNRYGNFDLDGTTSLARGLNEPEVRRQRGLVRQFYRALGPTKEWAENNYYHLTLAQQNAELIPINSFWRDYAAWDGQGAFLSQHVAEASRNFSEMMLALAVLDLPFEPAKHQTRSGDNQFTLTAAGPVIAFHKEIKPATPAGAQTELLVSQNVYRHGDRHREEGNEKFDKYVVDEFLAGVVYGANIVVTNPGSAPQSLELLLQIPQGALPVLGSKATDSKRLRLEPYTTKTFEYFFYFPLPAEKPFPHYPVHVARQEKTVGSAKAFTFKVVRRLSQIDKTSWEYVSQYGSDADVLGFLEQSNLRRLDLERIAWRARQDVGFFRTLIALLEKRHVYHEVVYSYAVAHNELVPLREWLRHREDFVAQLGPWLDSKLLRIDPIERRAYEQLEYRPLVNQRAHRLGAEHRIANPVLREQYQKLLHILAHKPSLEPMDQLSVVYYQFLQDRVEEALARLQPIKAEALPTRLQHDYLRCYAAIYQEQLTEARGLASQYADHPVDRWRKLFAEVSAQLDEIGGAAGPRPPGSREDAASKPDREKQQAELAATEPGFDFKVENRQIVLTWRNLREVTINYYLMDPEFLFSSSPFVTEDPGRFSIIKAGKLIKQALPEGRDVLEVPLPAEYQRANVLVEILAAGQRKAQAYHANTLKLNLVENYGRLELRDQQANQPVMKAYVKVYARLKNGSIRFFKDGYTDLRGKFDYASLNSSDEMHTMAESREHRSETGNLTFQMLKPQELHSVERLALLIMSDAHGVLIREAVPPSE